MIRNDSDINSLIPEGHITIWKYMNFPEFISLLQSKKLYFTRADKFEDKTEGSAPEYFLREINSKYKKQYNCDVYKMLRDKGNVFINCWSEFNKESYAMWQIYSKKYGIAIQTTVEKLTYVLKDSNALMRRIKYIEYDGIVNENYIDNWKNFNDKNLIANFFSFKPECYEYEKEIRAIIISNEDKAYMHFDLDIGYLIEAIVVSPFADEWFINLVEEITHKQYGLSNVKVCSSGVEIK